MYKLFLILLPALCICCKPEQQKPSIIFGQASKEVTVYDLSEIQNAGTLIGITLNGPDTYYEYHGQGMGTQFMLAQEYARHIGAKLQMETASDTAEMLEKLAGGEVDFIAMEMGPEKRWQTRDNTPLLTQSMAKWWNPNRKKTLPSPNQPGSAVRRKLRPVMRDSSRGIISAYDDLLIKAAESVGWDWRLLAAQCYQESGFDPQAESWMGAKGLMQIMPATAREMGIQPGQLTNPSVNIHTGARYLKKLIRSFSDIKDPNERTLFVLAAYNGGALHIRDAMALTRKYGGNDHNWKEVSAYILKLSQTQYYKDPVVSNGYMRGTETEAYVRQIIDRWQQYKSHARPHSRGSIPKPAKRNLKNGKHQSLIKSAEEFTDSMGLQLNSDSVEIF